MFRRGRRKKNEDWKKNKRAGKLAKLIKKEEIDKGRSFEWLKRGVMYYATK